jgi:hypothetical protein
MSLHGSLATMSVADLFDWLDRKGIAGEVTLERGGVSRRFTVAWSHITSSSSTSPAEYLGQMLINAGHLDEDTLRTLYEAQEASGMSIGKLLVAQKLVTDAILSETLQMKIREGFYDALAWTDGSLTFDPEPGQPRVEFDVRVPIRTCLVDGAVRAEQWKAVRQVIPSDDVRFTVTDPVWLDKVKPGSPSALLLGDVIRGLTVREIVLERHAVAFPVVQRLAELVQRRVLAIDESEPEPVVERIADEPSAPRTLGDVPSLLDSARARAKTGDARGALDAAKAALDVSPGNSEVLRVYQELERKLFAQLSRSLLTRFRVPKLLMKMDELEKIPLSAEERYLIGRIDGRWDLLSLMRVSPLREVEALITFQRLAERGVISLE